MVSEAACGGVEVWRFGGVDVYWMVSEAACGDERCGIACRHDDRRMTHDT